MPLQYQAPNFSGAAALAGRGGGNLNIEAPGRLGLATLQSRQQAEEAQRRDALKLMQLRQQGELGLRQQGIDRQRLEQQKLQQQSLLGQQQTQMTLGARAQQDKLGFERDKLGQIKAMEQAKLQQKKQQEAMEREMAQLADMKKSQIKERGAFASYARLALEDAKTPEEAQQLKTAILNEAVQKKLMPAAEAEQAAKMSITQFKHALGLKIMQYGAVKDFKAMQPDDEQSGSTEVILSDGTVIRSTAEPSAPVETEHQKQIGSALLQLDQLEKIGESYADEYLTWAGETKSAYGRVSSKSPEFVKKLLPGSEEAEKFRGKRASFIQGINRFFSAWVKEMTGVQFGMKELAMRKKEVINEEDDPAAFKAKYNALIDDMKRATMIRQELLQKGIPINSKKFNQEFQERMHPIVEKEPKRSEAAQGLQQHLKAQGFSDEEINAEIERRGL